MNALVVVLNYNGKKETIECLHSLKKAQVITSFAILIVDNGSTDGSLDSFIKEFPHELYLKNEKNLGYAEGNNKGIAFALENGYEFICLLNNDTVVDPYFMQELQAFHNKHPNSLIGATPCLYAKKDCLDHLGGIWSSKKGVFDLIGYRSLINEIPDTTFTSLDYVCGCCIFAHRTLFEIVGKFDERFFLFWEESDLCTRAKKAGYSCMSAKKALLWHKVSASFVGGKPHTSYYFWRNRFLWMEKNLSLKNLLSLYITVLLKEILKIFRHYWIKKLELFFLKVFHSKKYREKKEKLLLHRACYQGVIDYFFRRFYEGPSWLFEKKANL